MLVEQILVQIYDKFSLAVLVETRLCTMKKRYKMSKTDVWRYCFIEGSDRGFDNLLRHRDRAGLQSCSAASNQASCCNLKAAQMGVAREYVNV